MLMSNGQKVNDRGFETRRRHKSGQRVQQEGMYQDEWGGSLLLLQGDVFPLHPHMGHTSWTYKGTSAALQRKQKAYNARGQRSVAGGGAVFPE